MPSSRDQLPEAVYFGAGLFQLIGGLLQETGFGIGGPRTRHAGIVPDLLCPSAKSFGDTAHLLNVDHFLLPLAVASQPIDLVSYEGDGISTAPVI